MMTLEPQSSRRLMDKMEIAAFRPIPPSRKLTAEVVERITAEISAGRYPPGTKLPTEQELISALGVSRTVIREAVAALRARGLVTTRQGSGAFVSLPPDNEPYVIDREGLASLAKVIEVLELRMAVEIEAAELASKRASRRQVTAIADALDGFRQAAYNGERAVKEDFAFHEAIAAATGNVRFLEFLEFMGRIIIPRQSIQLFGTDLESQRRYLLRIETEHAAIFAAIKERAPDRAREEMRAHLSKSVQRYRRLASDS
jgi:GntR family transcriptional regulator, transcriptional repressor for pyruvate dehydrogenase complex